MNVEKVLFLFIIKIEKSGERWRKNMLFNKSEETWKELKGYWTAKEICQEPETWAKTVQQIKEEKDAIKAFIEKTTKNEDYDIILTGSVEAYDLTL